MCHFCFQRQCIPSPFRSGRPFWLSCRNEINESNVVWFPRSGHQNLVAFLSSWVLVLSYEEAWASFLEDETMQNWVFLGLQLTLIELPAYYSHKSSPRKYQQRKTQLGPDQIVDRSLKWNDCLSHLAWG